MTPKISNSIVSRFKIHPLVSPLLPLAAFSASAVALLAFRIFKMGRLQYDFLAWNLFLAWIPLFIAVFLSHYKSAGKLNLVALILGLVMWLLFFPNAPYIITDLLHLNHKTSYVIPIWYDALMLFSFAFAGLQAGFFSLFFIQQLLNQYLNEKIVWGMIGLSLALTGYGLYLGRILRWNSWDILTHPLDLLMSVFYHLTNSYALKFTFPYTFILSILYLMFWQMLRYQKEE